MAKNRWYCDNELESKATLFLSADTTLSARRLFSEGRCSFHGRLARARHPPERSAHIIAPAWPKRNGLVERGRFCLLKARRAHTRARARAHTHGRARGWPGHAVEKGESRTTGKGREKKKGLLQNSSIPQTTDRAETLIPTG